MDGLNSELESSLRGEGSGRSSRRVSPSETAQPVAAKTSTLLRDFVLKCRGGQRPASAPRGFTASFLDGLGAAVGIGLLAVWARLQIHRPVLIASAGASAVLVFAAPASPLAQPRPLVLGNGVSALVGTCVARAFLGTQDWLQPVACALAVGAFAMPCRHGIITF